MTSTFKLNYIRDWPIFLDPDHVNVYYQLCHVTVVRHEMYACFVK